MIEAFINKEAIKRFIRKDGHRIGSGYLDFLERVVRNMVQVDTTTSKRSTIYPDYDGWGLAQLKDQKGRPQR